jgi:hypothetical protein
MEEAVKDVRVCSRLRTRMYYVAGRDHEDLREGAPNAQYWCALTTTALGPDDTYCSPSACRPSRGCFEEGGAP